MKNRAYLLVAVFFMAITVASAQDAKTEKFKVYGNCGMCEKRIEKAVSSMDGVTSADWDKKTKMIEVSYDPAKVNVEDMHKAVAAVGHDTEKETADDAVYDELPACCHYDRKGTGDK